MFFLNNVFLFLEEYFVVGLIFIISVILTMILLIITKLFSISSNYAEKLSPYECGFDPYEDARHQFNVKFYLVGILFLIFDLEGVFLFPWVVNITYISGLGIYSMIEFIIELIVGYMYIWTKGSLNWN